MCAQAVCSEGGRGGTRGSHKQQHLHKAIELLGVRLCKRCGVWGVECAVWADEWMESCVGDQGVCGEALYVDASNNDYPALHWLEHGGVTGRERHHGTLQGLEPVVMVVVVVRVG